MNCAGVGAVKTLNNADGDDVDDWRGEWGRETEPGDGEEARPGFSSGKEVKEEEEEQPCRPLFFF